MCIYLMCSFSFSSVEMAEYRDHMHGARLKCAKNLVVEYNLSYL